MAKLIKITKDEPLPDRVAQALDEYFKRAGLPVWRGEPVSVGFTDDGEWIEIEEFELEATE